MGFFKEKGEVKPKAPKKPKGKKGQVANDAPQANPSVGFGQQGHPGIAYTPGNGFEQFPSQPAPQGFEGYNNFGQPAQPTPTFPGSQLPQDQFGQGDFSSFQTSDFTQQFGNQGVDPQFGTFNIPLQPDSFSGQPAPEMGFDTFSEIQQGVGQDFSGGGFDSQPFGGGDFQGFQEVQQPTVTPDYQPNPVGYGPLANPVGANQIDTTLERDLRTSGGEDLEQAISLTTSNFDISQEANNPRVESLKEGIAPSAYKRGETDYLIVGSKYARVFCMEGFPDTVTIGYLYGLYGSDYDLDVSLSVVPRQQSAARRELQNKLTIVRAQYEEEVERGGNRHRDEYLAQIQKLEGQIADLAAREEMAYDAQLLFTLYADSREELSRHTISLTQELREADLTPQPLAMRQDEAFRTVVPYGIDYFKDKKRNFNTGAIISSIPFYIPELYDSNGVYLGVNTFSGTPAMIDLYKPGIQNSNLNVFGASGSGKSTLVKIITMRSSLHGIRTVIIDPEGEYTAMTNKLHGAVVRLSTNPEDSVMMNIFDVEESESINTKTGARQATLELRPKYEDILGFIKVAYPVIDKGQEANVLEVLETLYIRFGYRDGDVNSLYTNDEAIIENGVLINTKRKRTPPQMSDFLNLLNQMVLDGTYPNLKVIYEALQVYRNRKTRGSFDTQTPKELQNLRDLPVITFDISGLESSDLRTISMYVLLSWIWEKFGKKNPHIRKRILVDEAWMMMSPTQHGYEHTSSFLETMSRRIRKRNGALMIATQKIEDFTETVQGSAIISNAHTTFLLSHNASDRNAIQKAFELDPGVIDNIIDANRGRVLVKQGSQLYIIDTNIFANEKVVAFTSAPAPQKAL